VTLRPISTSRSQRITVLLVVLLAAVLRIAGLGYQSRWLDEATTLITARVPFWQIPGSVYRLENMPPLYFFLINPWVHLTGDGDFILRLPSALFGIVSVAMMYRFVRHLSPPPLAHRFGVVAALMLAVSHYHIAYSQEARSYSLMFLLCLISCDAFVGLIQSPPRRRDVILYILSSAAMLWTHPFSGFTLAAQNVYYFFLLATARRAIGLRAWLTWQGSIVLLFSPWIGHIFLIYRIGSPWMETPHLTDTLLLYAGSTALLILLGGLALASVCRGVRQRDSTVLFAVLLLLLPFGVAILASTAHHPLFVPRYGISSLIGLYLLAAGGAIALGRGGNCIAIAAYCALAAPSAIYGLRFGTVAQYRPDVRSAAQLITRQAAPGDGLLIESQERVFESYWNRTDLVSLTSIPVNRPNRIWLVIDPGQEVEPLLIATPYHLIDRHEFAGIADAEVGRDP
jgi:uncharacterized membrane protein